ncbi:MAG: glycosyltransferase family 2 protein [Vampirovibrionales bacterium]
MTLQEHAFPLQIILITYNRANHVERTFQQLLAEGSPVRNLPLLVLDNNSTDATADVVQQWQANFPNISYQKNRYNVGLSGNAFKAMELASNDYVWIICDDDVYDFTAWPEVEQAIERGEELLCVSRYVLPEDVKHLEEHIAVQLTFIPAMIFKTSLLTDTVMRNAVDSVFTLFPHLCPVFAMFNEGKTPYVISQAIVDNGMDPNNTDSSYVRGTQSSDLLQRSRSMQWMVGYANVCSLLKDTALKHRLLNVGIQTIHGSDDAFYEFMMYAYAAKKNWMQVLDVWLHLSPQKAEHLLKLFLQLPTYLEEFKPNLEEFKPNLGWVVRLKRILRRPRSLFDGR